MVSPHDTSPPEEFKRRCVEIASRLASDGLFPPLSNGNIPAGADRPVFRISPEPFEISSRELEAVEKLGPRLLKFYGALNRLYLLSARGSQPEWIAAYLDRGKPETVVALGRMHRFKHHLPGVIRPDLILTEGGFIATELDSVPGGIGLTGSLARLYEEAGRRVVGGADGMVRGFQTLVRRAGGSANPVLAIVVSDESRDYRPEMRWLGAQLNAAGLKTFVLEPGEIRFTEDGLRADDSNGPAAVDVVYRFFELFDLKNIPKAELILFAAKKGKAALTPPPKAFLEEKMAFALYHHPALRPYWRQSLGEETDDALSRVFPKTWILDPRSVPPHAVIPGLFHRDRPVSDWRELAAMTQKERHYVIKRSGFSEQAWGSRGVAVGHDLAEEDWGGSIEQALAGFDRGPTILQEFNKGRKVEVWGAETPDWIPRPMSGRVRLSPYYFVDGEETVLGGILATICPLDKKLIHGMTDAVMAPCAVSS